ncbi:FAD/NAD(P)-binding protein [Methylocapsa sp. S129]|uniref:FAD/NAD(P)-binding protein n=1 Tax=Methylocapsa sp. S129 TaxID=1641869 RepID=UPI00131D3D23|nr:FAD/NAD(P)-binding protein [Methylocapsa sp. S129]
MTEPDRLASAGRLRIAVVGGGFTGVAFVIHATRLIPGPLDIDIIEPSAALGLGHAYSASDPLHRINVPSERMSLFAGDLSHATDWLFQKQILPGDGASTDAIGHHYVARSHYGAYVADTLAKTLTAAAPRVSLRHRRALATAIRPADGGWSIALSTGDAVEADRVALCFGHAVAGSPCPISAAAAADPRLIANPWRADGLSSIDKEASVLLVGTGLTMADMAASLLGRGHKGKLIAVSRRGLMAQPHGLFADDVNFLGDCAPPLTALGLLDLVRRRVRASTDQGRGWHPAIDALRYNLPRVWGALPPGERRAVKRRLLAFWDVHRFRVAPQVHAALAAAIGDGRLVVEKAGVAAIDANQDSLVATLRRPGGALQERRFGGIILCVGPDRDLTHNPLIREMFAVGLARADAVGLGLDVDAGSHLIARDGTVQPNLLAFGPMTRGTFGEMTGAPDIARHIERVAGLMAAGAA